MLSRPALAALLLTCATLWAQAALAGDALPKGFVYLDDTVPQLEVDLRYAGSDNFVGQPVDGYVQRRAVATIETAQALAKVEADLRRFGLGLKVFDAYRPQRAVDHFVRWAKDLRDTRTQAEYYPRVAKQNLFRDDYIAAKSGHSRGSTVDVTLVYRSGLDRVQELDMGTRFDYFDPSSWPEYPKLNATQRSNRMLLQTVMTKHGFKPYPQEWWHFTLQNEPFPEQYFNFVVK